MHGQRNIKKLQSHVMGYCDYWYVLIFLVDLLPTWANNGSCVEDIWKNFKNIVFEGIKSFVPHTRKNVKQNSDPEYYNKEVKRLRI